MAIAETAADVLTVADLLDRLGVPPERVLLKPPPGTATEQDLLEAESRLNRLCELVDGTLVEKAMGYQESALAVVIATALRLFVVPRNLGIVTGSDGPAKLFPGLVRVPDVAFASWDRFPDRQMPREPLPQLAPDLAIEVLSRSNTRAEMRRKRKDYFSAGVRLVWLVDPPSRTVAVYTGPEDVEVLDEQATLTGGDVLPGFALSVSELFAELDRKGA